MPGKRVTRDRKLTPEEGARYQAVRETFEREERTQFEAKIREELRDLKSLGAALRVAREAQGLSLRDVAERAGMDHAAISRIESGQTYNCTFTTLRRLAEALGKMLTLGLSDQPASARS